MASREKADLALVVDLARIVGPDAVSTSDADRMAYARDMWPRDLICLYANELPATPMCVVWPETPDETASVLKLLETQGVAAVPFGAGSGVAGGARAREDAVVLDLKRMRAIRRVDDIDLTVEVEAGMIGERLERALNDRGFTLGHFPSSIVCSTVGGWVAARSAGQMSTLYGKIEDMTLGLELATPGRVRRLVRARHSLDGIDTCALVIGSEGTLGAITAARFRIRPLPEVRELRGFQCRDVTSGIEMCRQLLRTGMRPSVVRLYDSLDTLFGRGEGEPAPQSQAQDNLHTGPDGPSLFGVDNELIQKWTSRIAGQIRRRVTQDLKDSIVRATVRRALGAPRVVHAALGVLPDDALLIVGFEGNAAQVRAEWDRVGAIAQSLGAVDLGPEPGEHWLKNRYNVSFKASKVYRNGAFTDTMEVAATWDRVPLLYRTVKKAIAHDAFVMAHFSHAYREGCSIYFTFVGPLGTPGRPDEALARYDRIWKNAMAAAHEVGGTLSHHHGVGLLKTSGMPREHGAGGVQFLGALKSAFDPRGILNPGKLGFESRVRPEPRVSIEPRRERSLPTALRLAVGEANIRTLGTRTLIRPPDESALSSLVRVAKQCGIALVSEQTGFRPRRGAVAVDLSRIADIVRLSSHSLFVEAEAGARVLDIENLLRSHGLTLGPLHPRAERRRLGAALAHGLLVRRGLAFGDLKDLCFAVRAVLPDGAFVETRAVPRSATGPELARAWVGGRGRFGIITRATLRIAVAPLQSVTVACGFLTLAEAIFATRSVLRAGVRPAAGRIVPNEKRVVAVLELVAHDKSELGAQHAVVSSYFKSKDAVHVVEPEHLARAGRFDRVVELDVGFRAAEEAATFATNLGLAWWFDFLTPEGMTLVSRIDGADTRARLSGLASRLVGSSDGLDDEMLRVARALDPRGIFQPHGEQP